MKITFLNALDYSEYPDTKILIFFTSKVLSEEAKKSNYRTIKN